MTKKVSVVEKILSANDQLAVENRSRLDEAGVFAINIMASPGAGKTSLIEQTLPRLSEKFRVAVVDGDIATSIDADRASEAGALAAIQINTGGNCHLDAVMLKQALDQLDLKDFDLLLVENVGNLVCPSNFPLGTHKSILVASVPEGDDKPYKYPGMYRGVDALIINKIDLMPYIPFKMDYFRRGVEILNAGLITFPISCTTQEGVDEWINWIIENVEDK
ncbi:MAG: hydrogenase nickel incorporation protein HypB [Anaerolineales bacterium]|uniref:Hydrogenase nickel incorporation protein HypB n=1 Tax=Candidatus Desulfolinea nitratireducens TaxID=2841698 RepID=A0A8J6TJH2_9CHLR|nr:hydrogenase nickel incorporation protein HypB [Candidatus Desulfolinea nitratireducens]MBL6961278.1 hydrogenase nickel incorporation protein HypB [Anaerolineales bacterium]